MLGCVCGCGRIAYTRGLTSSCYVKLAKLVRAGKTTWAALEKEGKALPAKPNRYGRTNYPTADA